MASRHIKFLRQQASRIAAEYKSPLYQVPVPRPEYEPPKLVIKRVK